MAFDWTEYLVLAKLIHDQIGQMDVSDEAICRCAVSRAYYATHCYSRNIALEHLGYEEPDRNEKKSAHQHLIDYYREATRFPLVGTNLFRLKKWRESCDYRDNIPPPDNISTMPGGAFTYAQDTITMLQEHYDDEE